MKIVFELVAADVNVAVELEKQRRLVKELTKELKGVEEGTKEYEDLVQEIAKARTEITGLQKAQRDLNREFKATQVPKDSLAGLRLEYSKLSQQISLLTKAERESDFGKELIANAKSIKDEIDGVEQSIGRFTGNVGNYKSAFDGLGRVAGIAAAGIALLTGGSELVETTRQYERLFAILKQSVGNDTGAFVVFDRIKEFARDTPFQVDELVTAFVKLQQRGFNPTVEQLGVLGDISTSLNKNIDQLVEAVLDAQQGEFERLKEFGIKFKKEGNDLSATFKGQTTTIENTGDAISKYILSLGQVQGVAGSATAVAKTLDGQISNLEDNFAQLSANIGSSGGILSSFVGLLNDGLGILNEWVSTPLSGVLQDQQTEFNALVGILQDANAEESTRQAAINELQKTYPDYIGNVNLETAGQMELAEVLEDGNKLFLQRIFLQLQEEKLAEFAKERIRLERELFEAENKRAKGATVSGDLARLSVVLQDGAVQDLKIALADLDKETKQFSKDQQELSLRMFGSLEATAKAKKEWTDYKNTLTETTTETDAQNKASAAQAGSIAFLREQIKELREELEKTSGNDKGFDKMASDLRALELELEKLEGRLQGLQIKGAVAEILPTQKILKDLQSIADKALEVRDGIRRGTAEANKYADEQRQKQREKEEKDAEKAIELDKRKRETIREGAIDSAGTAANAIVDIQRNRLQQETDEQLAALDEETQKKIDAAQGNQAAIDKIERDAAKKRAEIEKQAAKERKRLAIIEAIINTAVAVTKALTGAPPPVNLVLAGIAGVAGAAQVAVIASQKFAKGGFTGKGKQRDETGRRVAGVVHEDEYVAPTSQIQRYPRLFAFLENDRLRSNRPFAAGGFASDFAPQIALPGGSASSQAIVVQTVAEFSDDQITLIADRVAASTGNSVKFAVGEGLGDANRRLEREAALTTNRQA